MPWEMWFSVCGLAYQVTVVRWVGVPLHHQQQSEGLCWALCHSSVVYGVFACASHQPQPRVQWCLPAVAPVSVELCVVLLGWHRSCVSLVHTNRTALCCVARVIPSQFTLIAFSNKCAKCVCDSNYVRSSCIRVFTMKQICLRKLSVTSLALKGCDMYQKSSAAVSASLSIKVDTKVVLIVEKSVHCSCSL